MNATSTLGIKLILDGATQAEAQLARVADGMQRLGQLAGAFAGVVSVQQFVAAADAVTQLQNNLKLATGSATAAGQAYEQLFQIAQRSRTNFTELGNTFASITRATESLGLSQQQVLALTETIGNAITVSGASAQASQAALVQLGQGLASGTLRGEELNSVLEQTPRLAKALADGLGVSMGALRQLGQDGKLTAEAVVQALRSQQTALAEEVQTSVVTVGQALQQLKNAATAAVGDLDKASGSTGALATGLQAVATTIGDLRIAFAGVADSGRDFTAFGDGVGAVIRTIVLGATTAVSMLQNLGMAAAGLAAAGVQLTTGGGLSGARAALAAMSEDIARNTEQWKEQGLAILNSAGATQRAAEVNAQAMARLKREGSSLSTAVKPLDFSKLVTGGDKAKKEVDEFAAALDKVLAKDVGLSADYGKTLDALFQGYQKGRIGAEAYADAVAKLIAQQPFVKEGLEESARAAAASNAVWDEQFAAIEKARQATEDQIRTAREYLDQLEFETTLIGMNAEQRAVANAERELEAKGIKAGTLAYEAYITKIREAIRLREGKQAEVKAAEDAASAWQKTATAIEKDITDALMRGFESGKGFAENLRDTVVNMFNTMVLRPIISAVVNPVAGAITGSLGLAGTANAASGVSNVGALTSLASGVGAFGSGLQAGFGALLNGGLTEAVTAGVTTAFTGGTLGSTFAGLGTTLGALGPITLGIGAIASLANKGETRFGGAYELRGGEVQRIGGAAPGNTSADTRLITASIDQTNRLLKELGSTAYISAFGAFVETSGKGRGGIFAGGNLSTGQRFGTDSETRQYTSGTAEEQAQRFVQELQQTTLLALKAATDIPKGVQQMLATVDIDSLNVDQATALLAEIAAYPEKMRQQALAIVGLSDDTLNGLFKGLIAGEKTATETGAALADAIVGGVQNSIASAGAQAMTDVATQYMILPLVEAIMNGGDLQAALDSIDFERVGQVMGLLSSGTQELLAAGDWEGFEKAIQSTIDATTDQTKAADAGADATFTLADALDGTISSSVRAASNLDAVADSLNRIGKVSVGTGSTTASVPAFAVGTNYVPNDMLALIHQGERIIPAADNRALMEAVGRSANSAGVITSAFAGVGGSLAARLDAILKQLQQNGADVENNSYISAVQGLAETYKNGLNSTEGLNRYLDGLRKFGTEVGSPALGIDLNGLTASNAHAQFYSTTQLQRVWGELQPLIADQLSFASSSSTDVFGLTRDQLKEIQKAIVVEYQNLQGQFAEAALSGQSGYDEFDNLPQVQAYKTYIEQLDALNAEMAQKAEDLLQPLRDDIAGLEDNPFAQLAKQAQDYINELDGMGQATAENIAVVNEWREAMQQNTRDDLYGQLLSEEERNTLALAQLQEQFQALGVEMPSSTDAFRGLLDGLDTTTAAGQSLYDALLLLVPGFVDLANAAGGANAALKAAQSATDDAWATVQRAVEAQRKALQEQATVARSLVQEVQGVFDVLERAVKDLRGQADPAASAAAGQAFITNALLAAQTTGLLPDQGDLTDAITAVRRGLDANVYASEADAEFARLVLAGQLESLGNISGDQLSVAERQLQAAEDSIKALDDMLAEYKAQIDELRGINTSVLSVEEAIQGLQVALTAELQAIAAVAQAAARPSVSGPPVNNPATAGNAYTNAAGATIDSNVDRRIQEIYQNVLGRDVDNASLDYWYGQAVQGNSFTASYPVLEDIIRQAAIANGEIPRYDVGTNVVPRDMLAMVHQGEAIIPAPFNPWAGGVMPGGGSNTPRVERLLEQLVARVEALEAPLQATADHTGNTHRVLDQVTEGGNAIRSDVVATVAATV